jgi:ubiquinone/menaquinone biosynthesis C-methylase UbiE
MARTTLTFAGEMAQLQRDLAQCQDMVVRRSAVLDALRLRTGEHVLEVGCGGGFYAYEAGRAVGSAGRVCAMDLSADQIAAAQARCADLECAEFCVGDAAMLPYGDAEFNILYGVQVFEYIQNLDDALGEVWRVLKPGGRCVILATNWSSLVWHSERPKRMSQVLEAWNAHAPHADLPAILPAKLARAGMRPIRQTTVPVLNNSYHAGCFSYYLSRMIRSFVTGQKAITAVEGQAWLSEFDELDQRGAYFFCATPIITEAIKLA